MGLAAELHIQTFLTRVARSPVTGLAIAAVIAIVFLADISTPADNVSVSFAYLIPVTLSLFEARPRSLWYASATTAGSVGALVLLPPSLVSTVVMVAISVTTQWVVAALVLLQARRLAEANERAELQRRFVDILSHEVGTALTTVGGQSYRLTKLADQLGPNELRLRADKIRKAAERIRVIIHRIQFASTLGDGSFPAGDASVNLQPLLEQLADQAREEYPGREVSLDADAEPKHVTGDEMLLRQLFENLITNGIKYSPASAPVRVNVSVQRSSVRVVVEDKGGGLPQDELDRVRRPYYRGANSKTVSGAGLGLYVVEKLVEAHNGRLSLESEVGTGTRVTVELPRANTSDSA